MNAVALSNALYCLMAIVAIAGVVYRSWIAGVLVDRLGEAQTASLLTTACIACLAWDAAVLDHYGKLHPSYVVEAAGAVWQRGLPRLVGDRDKFETLYLKDPKVVLRSSLLPPSCVAKKEVGR